MLHSLAKKLACPIITTLNGKGIVTHPPTVHAAYLIASGALLLHLPLLDPDLPYPGLEPHFPCAGRMQRAIADLSALRSTDPDVRAWLRHNSWPPEFHPLADPGVGMVAGLTTMRGMAGSSRPSAMSAVRMAGPSRGTFSAPETRGRKTSFSHGPRAIHFRNQ